MASNKLTLSMSLTAIGRKGINRQKKNEYFDAEKLQKWAVATTAHFPKLFIIYVNLLYKKELIIVLQIF